MMLTRRVFVGGLTAVVAVFSHKLMALRGVTPEPLSPPLPLGEADGVCHSLGPLDLKLSQFGPSSFSWAVPEKSLTTEDLVDIRDRLIEESSTVGPVYLSPPRYVRQRLLKFSFDPANYSIEVPDSRPIYSLFRLKYGPEVDAVLVENERLRNALRLMRA